MNAPTQHAGVQMEAPEDAPLILMAREFAATPAQLRRAHLDGMLLSGMEGTVSDGLERLDDLLAGGVL